MTSQQHFQQLSQQLDAILYNLRCYRDGQRVRNDVLELLSNTPSLQPRSGSLSKGPSPQNILYLAGTVPISYNSVQYNIPVNIWIIEAYPYSPPIAYVTPVQGMIIKPKHRHVDSNGVVYLPYLSTWSAQSCNLTTLVATMSKVFSDDPPVRSAGPAPPAQPQPQPQPPSNPYPAQNSAYPPSPYGQTPTPPQGYPPQQPYGQPQGYPPSSYGQSPYPPQGYPPQQPYGQAQGYPPQGPTPPQGPYGQQPPQGYPPQQQFEDPAIVAKRNVTMSITQKIQAQMHEFNGQMTKTLDGYMSQSAGLEAQAASLQEQASAIERQKSQMDNDIEGLTQSFDQLTEWLNQNDKGGLVDIDAITEPKDPLAKQLLYLVAEDASIEDTLYYLEKKLTNGDLDVDQFLKTVRTLSNEQFIKRATIRRIHEKQRGGR